jgi:hypothetical protein
MFRYISFLTKRSRRPKTERRGPNPAVTFSSRDWADLPAFHPRRPDHE